MSDDPPSLPENHNRAGRYVSQSTGYRAFLPKPLPPNPPIRSEGTLQSLLSQADRALGRLDGSIQTLPNPDLFVFMYVRKEAVLSSQIEIGILVEATGYKRNRVLRYQPYIDLFGENPVEETQSMA